MKTIFVNGTFDVLHQGHLLMLNYARSLGDILLVAVDSDRRVAEKKGDSRPINDMDHRLEFMLNIKAVDMVFPFDTDEELEDLVKLHQPDIMVVGSDWKDKSVIGSKYAKELKFFDRIDEYSSTKIIQSIIDRG